MLVALVIYLRTSIPENQDKHCPNKQCSKTFYYTAMNNYLTKLNLLRLNRFCFRLQRIYILMFYQ